MTWRNEEYEEGPEEAAQGAPAAGTSWRRITGWVLGVVGVVAVFLGLFILFAGEDQSVGLGGDLSWRVGDISAAWAYGLLAGGGILLVIVLASALRGRSRARS